MRAITDSTTPIATEKAEKLEESKYINIPASTEGSKAGQKGRK